MCSQNVCLYAYYSLSPLLEGLDSIMPVHRKSQAFFVMEGTSKVKFMLRSLRHNHQQDIMGNSGVQGDCIRVFCVRTNVHESMFCQKSVHTLCINTL